MTHDLEFVPPSDSLSRLAQVSDSGITRGPLNRALFRLAGPAILAKALYAILGMVDIFWVGRLGAEATAAVNTAFFASWMLEAATSLTAIAILAHVARCMGAGDVSTAQRAASQGLSLGWFLGGALSLLAWFCAPQLFAILGTSPGVRDAGVGYLRVLFLAAPFTFTYINCEAVMRASGNTRVPLLVTSGMVLLNAILDPLLIFGAGPVPALGVLGAGIATAFAQGSAVLAFAFIAHKKHRQFPVHMPSLGHIHRKAAWQMICLGAPTMSIGVFFSTIYLFLSGVVAQLGTLQLATMGLGNRAETFTYLGTMGFGSATATMVGQNLGARQPRRAARSAWWSVFWMGMYGTLVGALLVLWPLGVLELFTNDPALLEMGTTYLRILGLCQGFMSFEIVLENAFAGAGNTLPPMLISVPVNLVRMPLALWIVNDLQAGILGIAWLLSITSALRGIMGIFWFSRNRWQTRELRFSTASADKTLEPMGG